MGMQMANAPHLPGVSRANEVCGGRTEEFPRHFCPTSADTKAQRKLGFCISQWLVRSVKCRKEISDKGVQMHIL
jgi:hypothetical protein